MLVGAPSSMAFQPSGACRSVKELLSHDLAVLRRVQSHFLHGSTLTCRLERDVIVVIDGELVLAQERAIYGRGMYLVVLTPPLVLPADRVDSLHLTWHLLVPHRFDAHDVR